MPTERGDGLGLIGARIRHLRRGLGLTLVEVAGEAGISQPFLSQIERGKAAPSMSTLEGLAHALGTTQAHLLDAVNSRPHVGETPAPATTDADADGDAGDGGSDGSGSVGSGSGSRSRSSSGPGSPVAVQRAAEGTTLTRSEGTVGGHTRLLPGGPNDTQFLEFVETNHVPGRFFEHPGREWLYVTRGTVLLEVGDSLSRLEAGDVARYDGTLQHRWYVPEGGEACLIVSRPG
ncbi:XRE family transcriptional regulator [Rhodococcus sp. IEGM 1408]|uniref:helix-turn-helix domain-containing protein n=1 Tax=Rhodococcus sp. IEGM 1408 TaxID=3082220 RepID=UPI002952DBB1|nr:XRE family transcriptional regulator [Rhodococcus sp. IEGM 1408]MDV8001510.1 XRE family transcriptional regulator [Rhodococcus sp. IEGM 1408]